MKIGLKKLNESAIIPTRATELSAGYDLYVNSIDSEGSFDGGLVSIDIDPEETASFGTGICISLPAGYVADIRPRSGMACKRKLTVINSPGTIDADYRGEIKVTLVNHGNSTQTINIGDRIAQMVILKHEVAEFEIENSLDETSRGEGGFGSTGR